MASPSYLSWSLYSTFENTNDSPRYWYSWISLDVDEWDLPDYDSHPELTDLVTRSRYFATRIPTRRDGNPRGKYPRKPLSWPAIKLAAVVSWEWDAEQYRDRLWQWEVEEQQKRRRRRQNNTLPATETTGISGPDPDNLVVHDRTKSLDKPRRDKPNLNKRETRKQRLKTRRKNNGNPQDQTKPTFEKPHYLAAIDAMHKKHQKYWVGCHICAKITAEWDGFMKPRCRELAIHVEDGLWEANNDVLQLPALCFLRDGEGRLYDCPCSSCYPHRSAEEDGPAGDHADSIDMCDLVAEADLRGEEAFRVRYVDRIERGRGRRRSGKGQRVVVGCLPLEKGIQDDDEEGEEGGYVDCGISLCTTDSGEVVEVISGHVEACQGVENEILTGAWEYLGEDSDDLYDALPSQDDWEFGKSAENSAGVMKTRRWLGQTTTSLMGRLFRVG